MEQDLRRQRQASPVGAGDYVVQDGDCISSLVARSGHFWNTLWTHPENRQLRQVRGDPAIPLPGDRLTIPPLREKKVPRETEEKHRFVRKGVPAKLRLRLMEPEDRRACAKPPAYKPRANQAYVLILDGRALHGQTDENRMIEIPIPPTAQRGRLTVGPDQAEFELALGSLDCGYCDYHASRENTCCMLYDYYGLLNENRRLRCNNQKTRGPRVCGRHIKQLRRIHLEDNKGLKW
jgi:hypothetical protein